MTKKELAERAGIRYPALSEMKTRAVINLRMIEKIEEVLNIKDLREIIDLVPNGILSLESTLTS